MSIPAQRMRAEREARGWSQREAVRKLRLLSKTQLPSDETLVRSWKKWEAGNHLPNYFYRPLIADLFDVDPAELFPDLPVRSTAYTLPNATRMEVIGWGDGIVAPNRRRSGRIMGVPAGPGAVEALRGMLAANIEADMQMGPAFPLPAIRSQLPLIEHLCHQARGSDRLAALRLGVQFAEFCGWLYQDYGECGTAKACTNLALDLAAEIDDRRVLSYLLMRKSNVATDCGEAGPALGLANAALARSQHLTPRLQAVALRQKAAAHALLGEYDGFVRAREAARIAAAAGMRQDEGDLAPYCTPSYVEMEAGASLVGLGRPAEAIPIFEESRSSWPAGNLRDRLLCLARLATAYAHAGDTEAACVTASEALAATRDITSARVAAELGRLRQHLAQRPGRHAVADLRARLAAAIGPAANAVPVHLEGAP